MVAWISQRLEGLGVRDGKEGDLRGTRKYGGFSSVVAVSSGLGN